MKQLSWLSSLQPLKRVGVREDVHSLLILLISTIGIVHCFTEITQLESVCLLSLSYHPTPQHFTAQNQLGWQKVPSTIRAT